MRLFIADVLESIHKHNKEAEVISVLLVTALVIVWLNTSSVFCISVAGIIITFVIKENYKRLKEYYRKQQPFTRWGFWGNIILWSWIYGGRAATASVFLAITGMYFKDSIFPVVKGTMSKINANCIAGLRVVVKIIDIIQRHHEHVFFIDKDFYICFIEEETKVVKKPRRLQIFEVYRDFHPLNTPVAISVAAMDALQIYKGVPVSGRCFEIPYNVRRNPIRKNSIDAELVFVFEFIDKTKTIIVKDVRILTVAQ